MQIYRHNVGMPACLEIDDGPPKKVRQLATPAKKKRCFLCDNQGFVGSGLNMDACPDCATRAEMEYQMDRRPKNLALPSE